MRPVCLALITISLLSAANTFSNTMNQPAHASILFEVVQERFAFDYSTVAQASIVEKSNGSYRGLHLVLKPVAAKQFEHIVQSGLNKQANLIFNKKVISTTFIRGVLHSDLLISGITRDDAQEFIDSLKRQQPKPPTT
jgi:hypothetical protein